MLGSFIPFRKDVMGITWSSILNADSDLIFVKSEYVLGGFTALRAEFMKEGSLIWERENRCEQGQRVWNYRILV